MRLILSLFSVVALLLAGAVVAPSFVDWNKYKPQIITQIKNATGLNVEIAGDLSLAVLPTPRLKVEGVNVEAARKVRFEKLLSMKSAEVSVAILPLLQKKVEVQTVTLVEPDIQVEIMTDGTPSWMSDKLQKAQVQTNAASEGVANILSDEEKQGMTAASNNQANKAMEAIALNSLEIEGGKLSFVDHRTKAEHRVDNVDVVVKADSLNGPFDLDGSVLYQEKNIAFDIETGRLPKGDEGLQVNAVVMLPDADARVKFDGVSTIKAPFDVQGQLHVKADSVQRVGALFGARMADGYNQQFVLDGLLSANQNKASYDNLNLSFGKMVANGKLSVENIENKNPLRVSGALKSDTMLDIDRFMGGKAPSDKAASSANALKSSGKLNAEKKAIAPDSFSLPMAVDVDVKFDLAGVKVQGKEIKGVFVDLKKSGKNAQAAFKALNMPGQGKVDGDVSAAFASSSTSPSGAVTYSNPSITYMVNGQIGDLAGFTDAFVPQLKSANINGLYKTAQFDVKGNLNGKAVSIKDSVLKLDDSVVGLSGSYQPRGGVAGRDKLSVDVSAGNVDADRIMQALSGKKVKPASSDAVVKSDNTSSNPASKKSAKEMVKPLQDFALPMDLGFDISIQKLRIQQKDVQGVRVSGEIAGKALSLNNASANNYAGAAIGVKGKVADINSLSGIDMDGFLKTSDVGQLMRTMNMQVDGLPSAIKNADANIVAKGDLENLNFSANVKALDGQMDVAGKAANVLDKPVFSNLSVGAKHPNMGQALEALLKDFKAPTSMRRNIDFSTKANIDGKKYTLSGMDVLFGQSRFGGDINIDMGGNVAAVRGKIQAGKIMLDELLGAGDKSKAKTGSSAASSGGTSGGASSATTSARWSKTPINLDWMNKVDLDVNLAASNIIYGKWNLENPSSDLKIQGGQLNINEMKAGIFGGAMTLATNVKAAPVSLTVNSKMNNINLEKLASALSGSGKLKSAGSVSFSFDVNGTGGSAHALINALNGKANLNGSNIILKGFDLAKMARGLAVEEKLADSVTSLVDGATRGGQTQFDTLKGDYAINNGVVNIASMAMEGDAALIKSTGYADLPKWFINTDHEITLKQVPDLKPFTVKIKGTLDNPSDTFGKNILEDYLGEKIRRKIGKELPALLGDDVTNKLQKFGILPQEQNTTDTSTGTAPDAANDNVAPTQQQPAETPLEKIIKDPKGAEDALKGVLDGLF